MHESMAATDIIVLPTVRATAPTMSHIADRETYIYYSDYLLHNTVLPSMNGSCAITLPVGLDAVGIPVGFYSLWHARAPNTCCCRLPGWSRRYWAMFSSVSACRQ